MEWISVKEMLPEYNINVLLYNCEESIFIGYRHKMEDDPDVWYTPDIYYIEDEKLTHWMPLPSPPVELDEIDNLIRTQYNEMLDQIEKNFIERLERT